jgi:hypothetical protein
MIRRVVTNLFLVAFLLSAASPTLATELRINGVPVQSIKSHGDLIVSNAKSQSGEIWTITNGSETYRIHQGGAAVLAELEKLRAEMALSQQDSKVTSVSLSELDNAIHGLRNELSQAKGTVTQSATGLCYTASLDLTATFGRTFWASSVQASFSQGMAPGPPAPTQNYIHVWARIIDNNPNGLVYEGYDVRGPFANTTSQIVSASAWTSITSGAANHVQSAWGYFQAIGCDHFLFSVVPTWQQ